LSAAGTCVAAALVAGAAAGAAGGTLILPLIGTIYGCVFGTVVGACVGVVYTPVVIGVLLVRHRRPASVYTPLNDIVRACSVLVTALLVALALMPLVAAIKAPIGDIDPLGVGWVAAVCVAAIAVAVRVLRVTAVAICRAWAQPWGVGS
jgi:hypothetical protein